MEPRLRVLDGWRGVSLLCILAAHLLPLGPKVLQFNGMVGIAAMATFFALSGFLITRFLLEHESALDFLVRRIARILPLAWLAILIAFPWFGATPRQYAANLLLIANQVPGALIVPGGHLWSLCIELQFYLGIASLFAWRGRRGLTFIPILCVLVTLHRIHAGAGLSIETLLRIDEVLVGGTVLLAWHGALGPRARAWAGAVNPWLSLALLLASSHSLAGPLQYFRPYFAGLLLGAVLLQPRPRLKALLEHRVLGYLAEVSYAVYVIHYFLIFTWLGSGDTLARYLKRPLLLGVTFGLAHLSTYSFEKPCVAFGKRLARRLSRAGSLETAG